VEMIPMVAQVNADPRFDDLGDRPLSGDMDADSFVRDYLARHSHPTQKAYSSDLRRFSKLAGLKISSVTRAVRRLLNGGIGQANQVITSTVAGARTKGLSIASTNRMLATLRGMVIYANVRGMIDWKLSTPDLAVPGREIHSSRASVDAIRTERFLEAAERRSRTDRGARDAAIAWLIVTAGLRASDVARLTHEDVSFDRKTVRIVDPQQKTCCYSDLPPRAISALNRWLRSKKCSAGPLFPGQKKPFEGARSITPRQISRIIGDIGAACGVEINPDNLYRDAKRILAQQMDTPFPKTEIDAHTASERELKRFAGFVLGALESVVGLSLSDERAAQVVKQSFAAWMKSLYPDRLTHDS
jgi:integrase